MQNTKLQNINAEEVLEELRKSKVKTDHALSSVKMLSSNLGNNKSSKSSKIKKTKKIASETEFSHSGLNLLKPFFSGKMVKYLVITWAFLLVTLGFYQVNLNINNSSLNNNVSASTNSTSLIITSATGERFYNILNMKIPENLLVAVLAIVILGIAFLVFVAFKKLQELNKIK